MEKYIEDARQDEKHVPDLLESIMRPTDPVKEELRPISFKMNQSVSKIPKVRVSTFGLRKSEVFPPEADALLAGRFSAIFGRASGQIFEKMRVSALRALTLAKLCPGFAKLSSRDQVGCYRSLPWSKIGELGSEKELFTLLGAKP